MLCFSGLVVVYDDYGFGFVCGIELVYIANSVVCICSKVSLVVYICLLLLIWLHRLLRVLVV